MIYKRPESKFWWVRIEKGSRVIQRSTKCILKRDAKDFEAHLRQSEFGPDAPTHATTLTEFWPELLAYWTRTCQPRTLKYYVESLKPVLAFAPIADAQLHNIKQPLVEKFLATRGDRAVATVNHSIRALRRALHIAAEKLGYITGAPKLTLQPDENKREAVVSEIDFQRILKAAGQKTITFEQDGWAEIAEPTVACDTIRTLFTLMYDGGLRAGEACRLEWKNVDVEKRFVFVESGKTKAARRRVGLTERTVAALTALRKLRPEARYCFTRHDRTTPLTVGWVSHKFMRLRKSIGLEDGVVLHSLRHSCASRIGNAGGNVLDMQRVFGWASPVIAARYVHLDDERLQALAGLLEPGEKSLQ